MKLITWNIGWGSKGNSWFPDVFDSIINQENPDFVVLQEVPLSCKSGNTKDRINRVFSSNYKTYARYTSKHQNSWFVFLIKNGISYESNVNRGDAYLYPWAYASLLNVQHNNECFTLANVHFDQKNRETQILQNKVLTCDEGKKSFGMLDKILLAGDFNCLASELGYEDKQNTESNTLIWFENMAKKEKKADHIVEIGGINIQNKRVIVPNYSSRAQSHFHFPVAAEFDI
jgi:endonuclease/exonuclease/phosphatase family metal-dependent hydrolase